MILSNTPARRTRRAVAVGLAAAGLLVLPVRPGFADDPKPAAEPDDVLVPKSPVTGDPGVVLVFKYPDDPQPKKPTAALLNASSS